MHSVWSRGVFIQYGQEGFIIIKHCYLYKSIHAIYNNKHITDKDFLAKIVNIILILLLYYTPKTINNSQTKNWNVFLDGLQQEGAYLVQTWKWYGSRGFVWLMFQLKNVRCTSFKWENGSISMQDGAGSYQRSAWTSSWKGVGGSVFIHHAAVSLGDTDVRVARTRSSLLSVIDSCATCDRFETIYYSTIEIPDQTLVL